MIWADRVGVVWAALVALFVVWFFAVIVGGRIEIGEVFLAWLILSAGPWVFLRSLRWVFVGGR